jgi:hypothetical protein
MNMYKRFSVCVGVSVSIVTFAMGEVEDTPHWGDRVSDVRRDFGGPELETTTKNSRGKFGVSLGAVFNVNASFQNAPAVLARSSNPGASVAGVDHFYDDGFNQVDSSGNAGNATYFWSYQNASQYNPAGDGGNGSITMNSAQTTLSGGAFSAEQDGALPAVELYWESPFFVEERSSLGIRAAFRWQRVEVDNRALFNSTIETISDEYSLNGSVPPAAPFSGSFSGPNVLLSDVSVRTISSSSAGASYLAERNLKADLLGLYLGPVYTRKLSKRLQLNFSAGGTAAWIDSDFSCRDGSFAQGSSHDGALLLGGYAGADLEFLLGDRSSLLVGSSYTFLEDFEQRAGGRSSTLEFDEGFMVRLSVTTRM